VDEGFVPAQRVNLLEKIIEKVFVMKIHNGFMMLFGAVYCGNENHQI
jgi:hypothetical protein